MGQSSEQLKSHIQSMRRELDDNLQELEGKVKDLTNWQVQFQRHPKALLGAAFAAGVLISAVLSRSGRSAARHVPEWIPARKTRAPRGETASFGATIWRDIKGAAGTAVTAQIYSVLGELIEGFKDQAANRIRRPVEPNSHQARRKRNGGREQSSAQN